MQTDIVDQKIIEIYPTNPINNSDGWIDFVIPPDPVAMTDLASTELEMGLCLKNTEDASPIKDIASTIAPINLFSATIFDQVDVYLGGKLVCDKSSYYAYRAYLQTLLSYDSDAKENHLMAEGWYEDTAGHMTTSSNNKGHASRVEKFSEVGAVVHVVGRIHTDITQQPRFMIPNIEIKFRFHLAPTAFFLMGAAVGRHKFSIDKIKLNVRRVITNAALSRALDNCLAKTNVKYPVNKVVMTSFHLSQVTSNQTLNNVYSGKLPKRIVVGVVADDAVRGTITTNPFNFAKHAIKRFAVFVNSKEIVQSPLQFDTGFTKAYLELYKTVVAENYPIKEVGISLDQYNAGGYNLYAFDLTPDSCPTDHCSADSTGVIRFEVEIDGKTAPLRMICLFEKNSVIEVTKFRDVLHLD